MVLYIYLYYKVCYRVIKGVWGVVVFYYIVILQKGEIVKVKG